MPKGTRRRAKQECDGIFRNFSGVYSHLQRIHEMGYGTLEEFSTPIIGITIAINEIEQAVQKLKEMI